MVLALSASFVILFAFIGPWGTTETLQFHQRLLLQTLSAGLGFIMCYPAAVLTLYLTRHQTRTVIGFALAIQCLVIALPGSGIPYTLHALFHDGRTPPGEPLVMYLYNSAVLLGFTALVYYVLCLISFHRSADTATPASSEAASAPVPQDVRFEGATAVRQHTVAAVVSTTAFPPGVDPAPAHPRPAAPARDAEAARGMLQLGIDYPTKPRPSGGLFARIPASLGRDLVYIKVSGHYLEIVTTLGSAVIVQRFSDAVEELRDRGLQIHRSYWVAHAHIRRVVRRDYRTLLHLDGGYEVPVSRTFLPAVHHHATNRAVPPAMGSDTD